MAIVTTTTRPCYRLALTLLLAVAAAQWAAPAFAARCYVNQAETTGADNGQSWGDAYLGLQSALNNTSCAEIWVAQGTYTPGTLRSDSFDIYPGVAVYGGFVGTESSRDYRDLAAHPTVLSGDIGAAGDNSDNSYHVIVIDGTTGVPVTSNTVLDGFTIKGGNAASGLPGNRGGGLYCDGQGVGNECSPSLGNLVFEHNHAVVGGAIFDDGTQGGKASPTLNNVTFIDNVASSGGAIYNDGSNSGSSSPMLNNVAFYNNSADGGGGAMYDDGKDGGISNPTLTNVTFVSNSAGGDGGAMYDDGRSSTGNSSPVLAGVTFSGNIAGALGGAMYNYGSNSGNSSPTLTNVTFGGNSAFSGGAVYNDASVNGGTSSPIFVNVTFNNNRADGDGGAMFNNGSAAKPILTNVILSGDSAGQQYPEIGNLDGSAHIDHSIIEGSGGSGSGWDTALGVDGSGNLDANPLLGPLQDNGGATHTMLPAAGSPAVDAGKPTGCPTTDQRGVLRPQGAGCDIGAVEIGVMVDSIVSIFGSNQSTTIWHDLFNPLIVQVLTPWGAAVQGATLYAVSVPAIMGQAGATCANTLTDVYGLAYIYCRADGTVGTYNVEVHAVDAPGIPAATFVLINSVGNGDTIFISGFDPPGGP